MKKRLRRKKHKEFSFNVAYYVSVNDVLGQTFVDANGQDVFLTSQVVRQESPWLARDMERWKLQFFARTIPSGQTSDLWVDDGWNIVFEFRALEFPKIKNWTGNNPTRFQSLPSD